MLETMDRYNSINPEDLVAGREQLEKEYFDLINQARQHYEEIEVLEKVLQSLESPQPLPKEDASEPAVIENPTIQASQKSHPGLLEKFMKFRQTYAPELHYAQTGLLGSFAAGGGIPGMLSNPERFLYNLGFNVSAGVLVAEVGRIISWLEYKRHQKLNQP